MLSVDQKRRLMEVARQALHAAVAGEPAPNLSTNDPELLKPRGAFVTLKKAGQLRGCIGYIEPRVPLIEAVADNARSAALHDPRFPPVTPQELFSSRPAARPDCLRKPGGGMTWNCTASRPRSSPKKSFTILAKNRHLQRLYPQPPHGNGLFCVPGKGFRQPGAWPYYADAGQW